MASFLHYVGCDFKRCLKSAAEDQGRQNEEKDEVSWKNMIPRQMMGKTLLLL